MFSWAASGSTGVVSGVLVKGAARCTAEAFGDLADSVRVSD